MENELAGAIKNALDRGESFQKAVQTLRNAGYAEQEISKAVSFLNPASQSLQPSSSFQPQPTPSFQSPIQPISPQLKKSNTLIILTIIAIILVILTAIIIFSDSIPYIRDLGIRDFFSGL